MRDLLNESFSLITQDFNGGSLLEMLSNACHTVEEFEKSLKILLKD